MNTNGNIFYEYQSREETNAERHLSYGRNLRAELHSKGRDPILQKDIRPPKGIDKLVATCSEAHKRSNKVIASASASPGTYKLSVYEVGTAVRSGTFDEPCDRLFAYLHASRHATYDFGGQLHTAKWDAPRLLNSTHWSIDEAWVMLSYEHCEVSSFRLFCDTVLERLSRMGLR